MISLPSRRESHIAKLERRGGPASFHDRVTGPSLSLAWQPTLKLLAAITSAHPIPSHPTYAMSVLTVPSPQLRWSFFSAQPDPALTRFDPELEALVESLTKRIAAPLPSLSFAPLSPQASGTPRIPFAPKAPATPRAPSTPKSQPALAKKPTSPAGVRATPPQLPPLNLKPLVPRRGKTIRRQDKENIPPPRIDGAASTPEIVASLSWQIDDLPASVFGSPNTASRPVQHATSFVVCPANAGSQSKDVIELLSLLDSVDTEMAAECQRIRDGIAEVRTVAELCRAERTARIAAFRKRREQERRETKEIGCDFWAGV
jgi:hypothetical protein